MKPARSLAVSVVALGFAGSVAAPLPAYAAPAPCERAEGYAAQSGAELLRIDRLEVRSGGGNRPVAKDSSSDDEDPSSDESDAGGQGGGSVIRGHDGGDAKSASDTKNAGDSARLSLVGLGEARTAMVATAQVKSAAVARLLDGQADGEPGWIEPLFQQAPPTHAHPATRATDAGRVGPLKLGSGNLTGHAQWDPAMACGGAEGETAGAQSAIHNVNLLGSAATALIRVPQKAAGVSTTALDGTGESARTVASATVTGGGLDLAGGRVRVRILTAPSLVATMSSGGGDVRYQPAQIEVSGDGIATKRLAAAGESVDVTLGGDAREAGGLDAAALRDLRPASRPLPLPHVPGLPAVSAPSPVTESAPAADGRMRLHITLGGVRQAEKGHAIAARVAAIDVSLTQGDVTGGRGKDGYGGQSSAVALDFSVGLMEAAAVAPERMSPVDMSGTGGGLPITGPGVAGLALAGVAMVLSGVGVVLLGLRRRRSAGLRHSAR